MNIKVHFCKYIISLNYNLGYTGDVKKYASSLSNEFLFKETHQAKGKVRALGKKTKFSRALQNSSIKAWGGQEANVAAGQEALLMRAKANSEAQLGKYQGSTDKTANESLFEASYSY